MPPVERRFPTLGTDPDAVASAGGPTIPMTAGAALNIGDAVVIGGAVSTVTKAAGIAQGQYFVGVAAGGGGSFGSGYGFYDSGSVGRAAAAVGKVVEVQVQGIAYVVAGAAIGIGETVGIDSATAGRVIVNNTAGQRIGINLGPAATVAGDVIRMLIQPR